MIHDEIVALRYRIESLELEVAALKAKHGSGSQPRPIIKTPQPDWGRHGTQPKGKAGPKPPPNGQLVATKPTRVENQ